MGLFFILLGIFFIVGFVITTFSTLDSGESLKMSSLAGLLVGIALALICAAIMGFVIIVNHAEADVKVASMNAQAEVYEYQLEQITEGNYFIEEQNVYQMVVAYNEKVATMHSKVDNKMYNWFNPAIYKEINKVNIPTRQ